MVMFFSAGLVFSGCTVGRLWRNCLCGYAGRPSIDACNRERVDRSSRFSVQVFPFRRLFALLSARSAHLYCVNQPRTRDHRHEQSHPNSQQRLVTTVCIYSYVSMQAVMSVLAPLQHDCTLVCLFTLYSIPMAHSFAVE